MQRRDLRDASVLARTELLAMLRRFRANRRQLALSAFVFLQFGVVTPMFFYGPVTGLGAKLAAGDPSLGPLGAAATALLVAGLYLGGASAFNQNRVGTVGPLIRTSVPPSAVAIGRLGSEFTQLSVFFLAPLVAVGVLVGIGAGGLLVPVLLGVLCLMTLLGGLLLGRTAGAVVRYLGLLSRLSTWVKVLVGLAGIVAIFVVSQSMMGSLLGSDVPFGPTVAIGPFLPATPMQGFVGVLTAPLGGEVTGIGLLATGAIVLSIPVGLVAATRAETAVLLYIEGEGGTARNRSQTSRGVPRVFEILPAMRVAWRHLLRTARDPRSMGHLLPLLFGGLGGGFYWLTQPDVVLSVGPGAAVAVGSALAGMAYCLNPLGDDREQLPLLLTSVRSTRLLFRGRAMAGGILGGVVAIGIGTPLALVGHSLGYALGQTVLAPVLLASGAGAALGVGGLFPTFERREYMSVERAHPSQSALLGFMFGWGLVAGAGVFLLVLTAQGALDLLPMIGAWFGYLTLVSGLGYVGYRYAIRRFDALELDEI